MSIELDFIARVRSPYVEKFGIPRQAGLVPTLHSRIEFLGEYAQADALLGLEQCSHIWLQFVFHKSQDINWRPKVRPPRLGGNRSMGVFATRSPVRPNPIGLSIAKIESIDLDRVAITVSGLDLLDETPILDVKPYVPYVDVQSEASNEFAVSAPVLLEVVFSKQAEDFCFHWQQTHLDSVGLAQVLSQLIAQDPRPAYHHGQSGDREYGMNLRPLLSGSVLNICWLYRQRDDLEYVEICSIKILDD